VSALIGPSAVFDESGRFQNPSGGRRPSLARILRWKLGAVPKDPHHERPCWPEIPRCELSDGLRRARELFVSVSYIGHATLLMRLGGLNVLTDPVFFDLPGYGRLTDPGATIEQLPPIDVVIISHNHLDHMQWSSLGRLPPEALFIVPRGLAGFFERRQRRVLALDWWESTTVRDAHITFVPAQHWSRRALTDENRSLWGGYVVEADGASVYFAGDTGMFDGFESIGRKFAIDLAALPIGAYAPRYIMSMQHMDPVDALDALVKLGTPKLLPIHWGAYRLSDEPLGEPPAWLLQLADGRGLLDKIALQPVGGTFTFSKGYPRGVSK
jgi:L-ascorbate metabolism protein UlaG (beta-lactamase superfamily)